jgi:hypothetical protein
MGNHRSTTANSRGFHLAHNTLLELYKVEVLLAHSIHFLFMKLALFNVHWLSTNQDSPTFSYPINSISLY